VLSTVVTASGALVAPGSPRPWITLRWVGVISHIHIGQYVQGEKIYAHFSRGGLQSAPEKAKTVYKSSCSTAILKGKIAKQRLTVYDILHNQ